MATRNRSKFEGTIPGGNAVYILGTLPDDNQTDQHHYSVTCTDQDAGDHITTNPFDIIRTSTYVGLVNGSNGSWKCEDYAQYNVHPVVANLPGVPDDSVAATSALARANPSRPNVDVWAFVAELRELPRAVKQLGDYLRKVQSGGKPNSADIASGYLGWTFGWKPLISDLGKLLDFQGAVDKRLDALKRLNSGELNRTVVVYNASAPQGVQSWYVGPSYGSTAQFRVYYRTEQKVWVRVRYAPKNPLPPNGSDEQRDLARSLVFGHQISHETLWNLMPWSWLIDWFSNVGDYIAAHNNRLGLTATDIAVMRHTRQFVDRVDKLSGPSDCELTQSEKPTWERKRRSRYVGNPVIKFQLPFLDLGQLSILSALAVTRLK
ncbi:MAG: putative maturation protein [Gulmivirus fundivivens]|uniref:Maturation protein n=1 Tax=Leviviridae sp. TaxID=2027243 RepID=A0ABY3SV26_9VIRU|nr:MAG: putative maturation protein [Leviviridae sp.]